MHKKNFGAIGAMAPTPLSLKTRGGGGGGGWGGVAYKDRARPPPPPRGRSLLCEQARQGHTGWGEGDPGGMGLEVGC